MISEEWLTIFIRLAVAGLGGLAVGIEREWSVVHTRHEQHFAGVRTFFLLGLLGAASALMANAGLVLVGAMLVIAAAALVVVGYAMTSRRSDVGGTTEVAALLVLGGGIFSGLGQLTLASGLFAVITLVLIEKTRLHQFVTLIQSQELVAAARFAVLALVVFPLLPAGTWGPEPGLRPRELWALVLLFSGLSFTGFLALRLIGAHRGAYMVGLLGGIVSSTATTWHFARESLRQPELGRAMGLGVVAACSVMPLRTLMLILLVNPPVGRIAAVYLVPPALVGLGLSWWLHIRRDSTRTGRVMMPGNPLRFTAAIQMAVIFQVVLFLVHWVQQRFGTHGLLSSAMLVGLTDVDALTYSMIRFGGTAMVPHMAAKALALGVLSNTLFKWAIAATLGQGRFRSVVTSSLLAISAVTLALLFLVR